MRMLNDDQLKEQHEMNQKIYRLINQNDCVLICDMLSNPPQQKINENYHKLSLVKNDKFKDFFPKDDAELRVEFESCTIIRHIRSLSTFLFGSPLLSPQIQSIEIQYLKEIFLLES